MSLRKFISARFLTLMSLVLIGNIITFNMETNPLQASLVDLNSSMFKCWKEWDALLTRWMDTNGTIVELHDFSRKIAGDSSNTTLTTFGGYLVALSNMFEETSNAYYLSKLRTIIDAMVSESWFYREVSGVGEIFYPNLWYYDGMERDSSPIGPGWVGYVATKLYLWTGVEKYLSLATRIASESLDKLASVNNSTDLAWSSSYYTSRNPENSITTNRQSMFVPFYQIYGKYVNSTFTNQISKMLHWQFKSQLASGGLAYKIGESTEAHHYTALQIIEYLVEYDEDHSVFSDYNTNIQHAIDWLIDTEYRFGYAATWVTIGALILADKRGFIVDSDKMKTMTYIGLEVIDHTLEGLHGGLHTWTFGWRWSQFALGSICRSYPMNDGTFDGNPTKIIDYSGAGNTKRLTYTWKTCSGGLETFYGLRTNSAYGNGAEVYYPGFPNFFFLYWGRLQGTPTTTITNGTYYLKATHDFGSGNIVRQYYYGTDVIINDVSGTREFEIYTENSNPTLDVMVENGTRYQLNSFFNSTKALSNNFLVIQRTAPKSAVYIYAPTISWAFENGTGYSSMKTTVSDVKLISATVVLGEFNAEPLIDLLTAFKYYGDNLVGETMPVSFVGVVEAYKSVKELYGKAKWGDVAWKTTYDKCLSDSDVKLVMHDSPETNNITSWALTSKKLNYAILGQPGTSSTTKIYCGLRGEPIAIYAVNGPLTESYSASTKILALNVTHQSSTRILVYWKFPGDVNDNGIIDVFDLALMGKAFGATPGSLNWDEDCDINGDEIVSETDLSTAEKDYGKSTP